MAPLMVFRTPYHNDSGDCPHDAVAQTKHEQDQFFGMCQGCGLPVDVDEGALLRAFYRKELGVWWRVWSPECVACDAAMTVETHRDTLEVYGRDRTLACHMLVCSVEGEEHPVSGWSDTLQGLRDLHAEMLRA